MRCTQRFDGTCFVKGVNQNLRHEPLYPRALKLGKRAETYHALKPYTSQAAREGIKLLNGTAKPRGIKP